MWNLRKRTFCLGKWKKAEELYKDSVVPRTAYIRINTDSYDMNILNNLGINLAEKAGVIKESVSPIMDYCVIMSGADMGGIYTTIFPVAIVVFVLASIIVYSIFMLQLWKMFVDLEDYVQLEWHENRFDKWWNMSGISILFVES